MIWWPGWDSVNNAGWWSHFWFWFGIACLFALGASEIVSHIYGLRKDELTAIQESNATTQRQNDAKAAETRHKTDVGILQEHLTAADKKVTELEKQQAPRRLKESEKQALVAALSPFRGQKITLITILGDAECKQFLEDFVAVLDDAKWDHNGSAGIQFSMFSGGDPVGVQIFVSAKDFAAKRGPQGVDALSKELAKLGLVPPYKLGVDPSVESWTIKFLIGRKPVSGYGYQ